MLPQQKINRHRFDPADCNGRTGLNQQVAVGDKWGFGTDLMYATRKWSTGALPSLSPCCHDRASSVSDTAMTAGCVGGDGGMHSSEIADDNLKWASDKTQSAGGKKCIPGTQNPLTVRGRADVSGHAGPALPRPAVRSHTDSVLGVHLQVAHVHVLGKKRATGIEERAIKEKYAPVFSLCLKVWCE